MLQIEISDIIPDVARYGLVMDSGKRGGIFFDNIF